MPASPTVLRLYRMLEHRSEDDLRHVFSTISETGVLLFSPLIDEPADADGLTAEQAANPRVVRAHESLKAAMRDIGSKPSLGQYTKWFDAQDKADGHSSPSAVRRAFDDSWTLALESLAGPRADVTARRLLSNGKRFSRNECLTGLRLFASSTGAARETSQERQPRDYARWARRYTREPGALRIPLSTKPITQRLELTWGQLWAAPEVWLEDATEETDGDS